MYSQQRRDIICKLMAERILLKTRQTQLPYYSQFASRELISSIVGKLLPAQNDPNWMLSGALNPQEYELWSWNLCGMACLKSILDATHQVDFSLIELAKRCAEFGGYKITDKDIDGLFYKEFVEFIKTDFGLNGQVAAPLSIPQALEVISDDDFVIASVHPMIRDPKSTPPRKGGHLVLLTGYDLTEGEGIITMHDPSGYYQKSQEFTTISLPDFDKFFANRGVIIENPHATTVEVDK